MGNRALKRRIAGIRQQITEHERKIAEERALPHADLGLMKRWEAEIEAFQISLAGP